MAVTCLLRLQIPGIPDAELAAELERILQQRSAANMSEDEAAVLAGIIFDLHENVKTKYDQEKSG
jgi:hypothetical protein